MLATNYRTIKRSSSGFTFIELLLVIVIIGVILAVVVPRAWRANVEAKYGLLRQAATELGSWGTTWAERNLEAQSEAIDCNLNTYVSTLIGYTGNSSTNWVGTNDVPCPASGTTTITGSVSSIMPPEKQPRNPFNGASYFNTQNSGASLQSGLLYLGSIAEEEGYNNYYFIYTGTDSSTTTDWHAGMGSGLTPPLANLRNGIFMARLLP